MGEVIWANLPCSSELDFSGLTGGPGLWKPSCLGDNSSHPLTGLSPFEFGFELEPSLMQLGFHLLQSVMLPAVPFHTEPASNPTSLFAALIE